MSRERNHDPVMFGKFMARLPSALGAMGFSGLRPGQSEAVSSILSGLDTLCVMPTAAGKTGAFILPALASGWRTIIFSPLKALIHDQVESLRDKGIEVGSMSSAQTERENSETAREWARGDIKILYAAPERMRNPMFEQAVKKAPPEFVVVDEMHCLPAWGVNFRADYALLGGFIEMTKPRVVAGFTATYTEEIGDEVKRVLGVPEAAVVKYYARRSNLDLRSVDLEGKWQIANALEDLDYSKGPALVYCGTKRGTEEVAAYLSRREKLQKAGGVLFYHGGMADTARASCQNSFMEGNLAVMVATNAFGMGVDKANIRAVIHVDYPGSPEALSQEIGRGGRDDKHTLCLTFRSDKAYELQVHFLECGNPTGREIRAVISALSERCEGDGTFHMSHYDISKYSGVSGNQLPAIVEILRGYRVITEAAVGGKFHKIHVDGTGSGNKWDSFMEALESVSDMENGWYVFDMDYLRDAMDLSRGSIMKYIKAWSKDEKVLRVVSPPRSKPYRLVGDEDLVDFEALRRRRAQEYEKLEAVETYLDTPDEDKHEFLENYFAGIWGLR